MNLTENESQILLDELEKYTIPTRKQGDIDRYDYAERFRLSTTSAGERLKKLVEDGILIDGGLVWDPNKRSKVRVYRKMKKPPEGG